MAADLGEERSAEHEATFGQRLESPVKKLPVSGFPGGRVVVALHGIVDADKQRQDARLEGKRILVPALQEAVYGITADSSVVECQVLFGVTGLQVAGAEHHVAVAVDVVPVDVVALG